MKTILRHVPGSSLVFLLLITLLSAFAIAGINQVPFHPDESTYLYTSLDFNLMLRDPLSMAWYPETWQRLREVDRRLYQRLLDAPLLRYTLGLSRTLAGYPVTEHDWEWALTWEENQNRGALPSPALLSVARLATTLFLPLSLTWLFLIGRKMAGPRSGLAAMIFFGLNALTLLHARRAMAEGILMCGILFAIWSLLQADRRPWLAGLAVALALNAKQTALVLAPIGLLAIAWTQTMRPFPARKILWGFIQYGVVIFLVTLALNPFAWRSPIQAAKAAWQARTELSKKQVSDSETLTGKPIPSPAERSAILLINLYFAPPAFAEYANYQPETQPAEQNYLANPAHRLLRGVYAGGLLLGLSLIGMALALLRVPQASFPERRHLVLLLITTLALFLGLAWIISLPWQRYVMPLVPLVALWQGYAVARLPAFRSWNTVPNSIQPERQ